MILRKALFLMALALLAACSPEYNWRQVSVADGMAQVLMPAKPDSRRETLMFAGHPVDFTLVASTVGETTFAVGYAAPPPELALDPDVRQQLVQAIAGSFYQKLGAPPPAEWPSLGQVFDIQGTVGGKPIVLQAKILWTGRALLEGMVTAPPDSFPEMQAGEFLASVTVGDR